MQGIRMLLKMSFCTVAFSAIPLFSEKASLDITKEAQVAERLEKQLLSSDEVKKLLDSMVKQKIKTAAENRDNKDGGKSSKKELEQYKVTRMLFPRVAFNAGFLVDCQGLTFDVLFKDPYGNVKMQTLEASIISAGLKAGIALKNYFILFTSDDLSYLQTEKGIMLGMGVDLGFSLISGLGITYIPFLNAPGGLFLFYAGVGLNVNLGGGLVIGGSLRPIKTGGEAGSQSTGKDDNSDDDEEDED